MGSFQIGTLYKLDISKGLMKKNVKFALYNPTSRIIPKDNTRKLFSNVIINPENFQNFLKRLQYETRESLNELWSVNISKLEQTKIIIVCDKIL